MQKIASHIERAFLVRDLISEDRVLSELLGSVMARAGFGVILAAADGIIVYVNDAADALMRASNGLRCERNCISATDFTTSRKLQSLIAAASRQTDEWVQGGSLIFRDEDGVASLVVHVVPLCPNSADVPPRKEHPVAGLVMVDCKQEITDRINVFAEMFGLTSAEARVVSQLVSGGGLTKAASRLNIVRSTARFHLTRIWKRLAPTARRSLSGFLRSNNPLVWTPADRVSSAKGTIEIEHLLGRLKLLSMSTEPQWSWSLGMQVSWSSSSRFAALHIPSADGPPQRILDKGQAAFAGRRGMPDRRMAFSRRAQIHLILWRMPTLRGSPRPSRRAAGAGKQEPAVGHCSQISRQPGAVIKMLSRRPKNARGSRSA